MTPIDTAETLPVLIRMLIALACVVALMGGLAFLIKRTGLTGALARPQTNKNKRLAVKERLYLDPRRQLIIASCDEEEHLILLGAQEETLLTTLNTSSPPQKDETPS